MAEEGPRPLQGMAEIDICRTMGIFSLHQNEFVNESLRTEQERSVRLRHRVGAVRCTCLEINEECCRTLTCTNRQNLISCPRSCSKKCTNRPWLYNNFAVHNRRTRVEWRLGSGFVMYATAVIHQWDFIGELTGVVFDRNGTYTQDMARFVMNFKHVPHWLYYGRRSSSVAAIQDGDNPNTMLLQYSVDGTYRLVYVATRMILPGQEIVRSRPQVVDVTTTALVPSNVGRQLQVIMQDTPRSTFVIPTAIDQSSAVGSGQVQADMSAHITEWEFDARFNYRHDFNFGDSVAFINFINGSVRIETGRVVNSFYNQARIFFYVIRRVEPAIQEFTIPMWLVFQHRAAAVDRYYYRFDQSDYNSLFMFWFHLQPVESIARILRIDVCPSYSRRVIAGSLLPVPETSCGVPGHLAAGIPLQVRSPATVEEPEEPRQIHLGPPTLRLHESAPDVFHSPPPLDEISPTGHYSDNLRAQIYRAALVASRRELEEATSVPTTSTALVPYQSPRTTAPNLTMINQARMITCGPTTIQCTIQNNATNQLQRPTTQVVHFPTQGANFEINVFISSPQSSEHSDPNMTDENQTNEDANSMIQNYSQVNSPALMYLTDDSSMHSETSPHGSSPQYFVQSPPRSATGAYPPNIPTPGSAGHGTPMHTSPTQRASPSSHLEGSTTGAYPPNIPTPGSAGHGTPMHTSPTQRASPSPPRSTTGAYPPNIPTPGSAGHGTPMHTSPTQGASPSPPASTTGAYPPNIPTPGSAGHGTHMNTSPARGSPAHVASQDRGNADVSSPRSPNNAQTSHGAPPCDSNQVNPNGGILTNNPPEPPQHQQQQHIPFHGRPERVRIRDEGYDPMRPRRIQGIVKKNNNKVLHRRQFEHAVEHVTFFALRRQRQFARMKYEEMYKIATEFLQYYYFDVQPKSDRKFLLSSHYRVAIEVESKGSTQYRWCSLCKLLHTFTTAEKLNQHFHKRHQICGQLYACPTPNACKFKPTNLASVFRDHIMGFHKDLAQQMDPNLRKCLIDAIADYMALKSENKMFIHLLPPGLPSMRWLDNVAKFNYDENGHDQESDWETDSDEDIHTVQPRHDTANNKPEQVDIRMGEDLSGDESDGHEEEDDTTEKPVEPIAMNTKTGKPKDESIAVYPVLFRRQQQYSRLGHDQNLHYAERTRFCPDLNLNIYHFNPHPKQPDPLEQEDNGEHTLVYRRQVRPRGGRRIQKKTRSRSKAAPKQKQQTAKDSSKKKSKSKVVEKAEAAGKAVSKAFRKAFGLGKSKNTSRDSPQPCSSSQALSEQNATKDQPSSTKRSKKRQVEKSTESIVEKKKGKETHLEEPETTEHTISTRPQPEPKGQKAKEKKKIRNLAEVIARLHSQQSGSSRRPSSPDDFAKTLAEVSENVKKQTTKKDKDEDYLDD